MYNKKQEEGFELMLSNFNEEDRKQQLANRKVVEKYWLENKEKERQEKLRQKRLRENQLVNCEHCNIRITRKHLKRHQLTDSCRINSIKEREWKNKIKMLEDKIKLLEEEIKEYKK